MLLGDLDADEFAEPTYIYQSRQRLASVVEGRAHLWLEGLPFPAVGPSR